MSSQVVSNHELVVEGSEASAAANSWRAVIELSVYRSTLASDFQRPCIFKAADETPAAAAHVVPPRRPECSPKEEPSIPSCFKTLRKSFKAV